MTVDARLSRAIAPSRTDEPVAGAVSVLFGEQVLVNKRYPKAEAGYRELAQRFPAGSHGSYAHWKSGLAALADG